MPTRAATYNFRLAPTTYDGAWLNQEFQSVQRALPTSTVRKVALSTTQLVTDRVVIMQALTAPLTFTLLAPTLAPVFPITVKLSYDSLFGLTIAGTVDGTTNPAMGCAGTSWTMVPDPDGTRWVII